MPARLLRYAQGSFGPLTMNGPHQFALDYAVAVYPRNTIFSFIPKNGCTSLRYSAALENQVITGPEGLAWVHSNNTSFRATFRDLVTASYSFVVLRCPFRRLVSCFLHKIVDQPSEAPSLQARAWEDRLERKGPIGRPFARIMQRAINVGLAGQDDISFADFVALLETRSGLRHGIHWRPQVDYLVYRDYDDVFRLEDMTSVAATVRAKAGFAIHDARPLTGHGNDARDRIDAGFFGRTRAGILRRLKAEMKVPAYERFFDAELYRRVARLYREDVELYARQFGQSALMQL